MQDPDYLNVLKITDIPQVAEAVAGQVDLKLDLGLASRFRGLGDI